MPLDVRVGGKKKEVSEELRQGLEIFGVEKSVLGGKGEPGKL